MRPKKRGKKAAAPFEEPPAPVGFGEDMRELTHHILESFDARAARVSALRQETVAMLQAFRREMKSAQQHLRRRAGELREFLKRAESTRINTFRRMQPRMRAEREARTRWVGQALAACRETLVSFGREREAQLNHWERMAEALASKRSGASG